MKEENEFLLEEHKFCQKYAGELIDYIQKTVRNMSIFFLSTISIFIIQYTTLTLEEIPREIFGVLIGVITLALSLGLITMNIQFGRLLNTVLLALWIEEKLKYEEYGIWHIWYGKDKNWQTNSKKEAHVKFTTIVTKIFTNKKFYRTPMVLFSYVSLFGSIGIMIMLFLTFSLFVNNLFINILFSVLGGLFLAFLQRTIMTYQIKSLAPTLADILNKHEIL